RIRQIFRRGRDSFLAFPHWRGRRFAGVLVLVLVRLAAVLTLVVLVQFVAQGLVAAVLAHPDRRVVAVLTTVPSIQAPVQFVAHGRFVAVLARPDRLIVAVAATAYVIRSV